MINEVIRDQIVGKDVKSSSFGDGSVSGFFMKNDDQYYISVLFEKDQKERTFLASTAFSNKIIVLDDADLDRSVTLALKEHENETKRKDDEKKELKKVAISPNDAINILIENVLNDRPIASDLISFYDDMAFEKELCEEAFGYLESLMSGSVLSNAHNACIVCALTLIALKYYDGDLHTYIEATYREYRPETEFRF